MNKVRRKELAAIVEKLEELDALREEIKERLGAVIDEEQEAFDNLPDSLKVSERGEQIEDNIYAINGALVDLEDLEDFDIDNIIDQLQDVIG